MHFCIYTLMTLSQCPTAFGNYDTPLALSEEGFTASIEPRLSKSLKVSNEAITHHNLGLVLLSREDVKAAALEFQAAIQLSPEFSDAYHGFGLCLMKEETFSAQFGSTGTPSGLIRSIPSSTQISHWR
ncbi:MAG: tetratricopeptide repeat protein [Nitrospira sp.]|nr:tetratricopeptide repeat protein [Nitrospira sp.]